MNPQPTPQAEASACLRRALRAVAEAARLRLSGALGAMVLSLLLHLLRRLDDAAAPAPEQQDRPARLALLRAEAGLYPHPLSAHVDAIDLGLVAGWMMRGHPARGMRPARHRRTAAPTPPARHKPQKNRPPPPSPTHVPIVPLS
jgi:hypothetical protein